MPFSLPSSVTHDNVMQVQKEGLINLGILSTVDCSNLIDFDSTVLTVLLAWKKKMQVEGLTLTIVHAPEKLKVLAGVYGVDMVLGLT
jgi:phospholipid transport system transporter-binding protein